MLRITIGLLLLVTVATCAKQFYGTLKDGCEDTDSGIGCKCRTGVKDNVVQYAVKKTDAECRVPLEKGQSLGGLKKECKALKDTKGCICELCCDGQGSLVISTHKGDGDCRVILDKNGKPIPTLEDTTAPPGAVNG